MSQHSRPVCIVTGGSSGVGLATAKRFAREGFAVAICGRDEERLGHAQQAIAAAGGASGEVVFATVDLSEPKQGVAWIDRLMDQFGRVDVLVNNAATAPLAPLHELDDESFETAVDVNIRSLFYLTRRVWGVMKQQNGGSIFNISSLAAVDPFPGFSVYGACKAWLDLFTVALGNEGRPFNIQVVSIRAGAIETPLLRRLFPDFPAHQALSPETVADVLWGLQTSELKHVTGEALVVKR